MPQKVDPCTESLIPQPPLPPAAHAFNKRMRSFMDGQPKDEATVVRAFDGMEEMIDLIAAKLYNLASMLVGEGEESIGLVESAIANAEVSLCHDPAQARKNSRLALCQAAVTLLGQRDPGSLTPPERDAHVVTCLEDDDLEGAGITREDLDRMIEGPDRQRVRTWLESLPTSIRAVFVLRAVAGLSGAETAGLLAGMGGEEAAGWTPDGVREIFRQGLCSLASQLIHASVVR